MVVGWAHPMRGFELEPEGLLNCQAYVYVCVMIVQLDPHTRGVKVTLECLEDACLMS